jgi:hypothetical protein
VKKRRVLLITTVLVLMVAIVPLRASVASLASQPAASAPQQGEPEIPDLRTLLNYPYPAHIEELEVGHPDRLTILGNLMARPEYLALQAEMVGKGFSFDPTVVQDTAIVMRITVSPEVGVPFVIDAMTVVEQLHDGTVDLSGAITAMQPVDASEGFYQAHHTNLDPHLAEVPDPPIYYNGMPYFYITTLHWIGGRIIYWNYWWFDSGHHPNWYYAHYYWYWHYYGWYGWAWPYWYWWGYGWYYWRYWYYWSTWFPYYPGPIIP